MEPPHRTNSIQDLVESHDWEPLTLAAYLSDLFASIGNALSDQHFNSYENDKNDMKIDL